MKHALHHDGGRRLHASHLGQLVHIIRVIDQSGCKQGEHIRFILLVVVLPFGNFLCALDFLGERHLMDLLFLEGLDSVLTPVLGDDVVILILCVLLERWLSMVHLF